jgi:hypothetical protein
MQKSAESQDRTAKVIEQAAEGETDRRDTYREYAAQHREFAEEDRRMAQQLRESAEGEL